MIREEVCSLVKDGKEIEAYEFFKENKIGSSKDEILRTIIERECNAKEIYKLFLQVANCIALENSSINSKARQFKEHLETFIPSEFTNNWGRPDDKIPEYLESVSDREKLFENFWIGLRKVNESDVAIGAAWAAYLHLNL